MVAFRLVIGETSQHITGPRCSYMQDKSEKCGSVIWKFFLSRSGNAYFLPLFCWHHTSETEECHNQ